jgi:WD40 repeat protein
MLDSVRITRGSLVLLALLGASAALPARAADPKKAAKVTYDEHVLPILRDKCNGCHNQDKKRGGLIVSSYTGLMAGGSSGEVVKPGDPDNSRIYLLAAHKQEPFMPPKSAALPAETLEVLRKWIADGALENAGSKARVVNKPKVEISLSSVTKGKPDGPPPMPPATLCLEPVVRSARADALTGLAASPWAPLVAIGGQKQVLLYQTDTLELLGVLPFLEGTPRVLKFSRNGSLLLAGGGRAGKSGRVVVWSVKTGERIFEVGDESDSVLAADISADQTQIALGGPSKVVRIYSTKDGQLLREIKKHTDWIYALEYSPDGVLLATADRSGSLFVWEAFTGREYFSLRGHTAAVTDLSWRLDSNVLASASEDTTVRLWEMENGNAIKSWGAHGGGVAAVVYTRDGRLVTCGRDQACRIWDGNGTQQRIFEAFPDLALRSTFSHDGGRVIAGDWTGQIRVWTAADGKFVGNLLANPATVAERLETATKEFATREATQKQLVAAATASQAAAQKSAEELAAAQKTLTVAPAAAKAAAEALAKIKEAADKSSAALASAQAQVVAKGVLSKALAEAAAKVKDAADKAKDNKELAAAATRGRELATQAANELTAAQKSVAELTPAAKTAAENLVKAQQTATTAAATAANAPKQAEAQAAAAKASAAKAAADKVAADQGAIGLALLRSQIDRLKAAQATAKVVAK